MNTLEKKKPLSRSTMKKGFTQAEVDMARNSPDVIQKHEAAKARFKGMDWDAFRKRVKALEQAARKKRKAVD